HPVFPVSTSHTNPNLRRHQSLTPAADLGLALPSGDFSFSYVGILAGQRPAGHRRTPRCHGAPLPTLIATPSRKMGSAMSRRGRRSEYINQVQIIILSNRRGL
uniref:Uncharacterized protein n=1 Tax=Triticum urartu TaxID=4572 RepID=A0A8R7NZB1_TRIUA